MEVEIGFDFIGEVVEITEVVFWEERVVFLLHPSQCEALSNREWCRITFRTRKNTRTDKFFLHEHLFHGFESLFGMYRYDRRNLSHVLLDSAGVPRDRVITGS